MVTINLDKDTAVVLYLVVLNHDTFGWDDLLEPFRMRIHSIAAEKDKTFLRASYTKKCEQMGIDINQEY